MAKELKKITEGRVKDRGVTWFPELVDKSKFFFSFFFFLVLTCIDMCLVCINLLIRKKHQGTPLLGNEELWCIT